MKKKLILLVCMICCFLIPNVRGIERVEETFLWELGFSGSHGINIGFIDGETISWSFETYDDSFEVSILLDDGNDQKWLSTQDTKDSGNEYIEGAVLTYVYIFFLREENLEGYIHIIIENFSISSYYPLFLTLGIIGIIIVTGYGIYKLKRRQKPRLTSYLQTGQSIHLAQPTSPTFCFECGHTLPPNATFCTNCGKKLV